MSTPTATLQPRKPTPVEVTIQRGVTRCHVFVYRATGGRIGHHLGKVSTLLLTTIGRKTGLPRVTPLTYFQDGNTFVLVASNGGTTQDPIWFRNLLAHPAAEVQVGPRKMQVLTVQATSEERARLWPIAVQTYAGYAGYQQRTAREIPLVLLHPQSQ